jgi:hypothetical protein
VLPAGPPPMIATSYLIIHPPLLEGCRPVAKRIALASHRNRMGPIVRVIVLDVRFADDSDTTVIVSEWRLETGFIRKGPGKLTVNVSVYPFGSRILGAKRSSSKQCP